MKNNTNFLVVYIRLNVNISRHAKAKQGKVKDAYIWCRVINYNRKWITALQHGAVTDWNLPI
jgi:hypothetical protein